jgi:TonB family protein
MEPVNKSDWRSLWSLWSAGAWYRFGSPFLRSSLSLKPASWTARNHCGLMNGSIISEITSEEAGYQSGPERPHSKGSADSINAWTSIKCLAIFIFILLSGQIFGSGEAIAETRQVEELTVVSTAAPVYPPIAHVANVQGEVIVSVSVNAPGDVIAAQVLEGHALLRKAAESAALKWKFNSLSQSTNTRVGQIIFSFKLALEEAVGVNDDVTFTPPGRLEITHKIPTIRPIQGTIRPIQGRILGETCPLHGRRMQLGLANILYGLPEAEIGYPNDLAHIWQNIREKIRRRNSYYEAARKYFPESNFWVGGGCMVGVEKKAETLYCQSCRNAELRWRKKHPGKGIGFDAVISSVSN